MPFLRGLMPEASRGCMRSKDSVLPPLPSLFLFLTNIACATSHCRHGGGMENGLYEGNGEARVAVNAVYDDAEDAATSA